MGRSSARAARFTGEAVDSMPRPLGRSGCVTTSLTPKPAATSFSSVGTANSGVPQNTKSIIAGLPVALLQQLANLALHHVALQRADMSDVEFAVQVIGLVQKSARQKYITHDFNGFALKILRSRGDLERTCDVLAKFRNTQASFTRGLPAFGVHDLGIDEHDLGFRIFLEGYVDHRDAFADPDLWSGQPDTVRGIHALEHVVGQLAQFVVEFCDGGRRLLQDRVTIFHDGIDHLEVS